MRRRTFMTFLGGAVLSPQPLSAQRMEKLPVVGFLGSDPEELVSARFRAFREGLAEAGYVDARNVAVEYLWSVGRVGGFPELASDFVRRRVAVIAALAGIPAATAAKAATSTIPIVFQGGFDPVEIGLVASLSRPGGNLTGVTNLGLELGPKRFEVMRELLPAAKLFRLLINPDHPNVERQLRDMQAAARTFGVRIENVFAREASDFEVAFADSVRAGANALIIGFGQPFTTHAEHLGKLADRYRIPAICEAREFVAAGGLVSYSGNREDAFRLAGLYVGRILKGDRPADLPVQQATRVEMLINMKAAKNLGLEVPLSLLGRADGVIE